ncbi:hypothetical protein CHUAL_013599 [Chamberlinius hualienensis]
MSLNKLSSDFEQVEINSQDGFSMEQMYKNTCNFSTGTSSVFHSSHFPIMVATCMYTEVLLDFLLMTDLKNERSPCVPSNCEFENLRNHINV